MASQYHIRLRDWTGHLLSQGKFAFSLEEAKRAMPEATAIGLKRSLNRESVKGNILSVHRGYYIIIPPTYKARGILPPALFIDGLMRHLGRDYYVSLLNAAAWHGAAHQSPQEFYVVTQFPVMRPTEVKGIRIRYLSRNGYPAGLIETRNTETGTVTVSNPLLTAADLVQYEKHIGGLSRATTVLKELAEKINKHDAFANLVEYTPVSVLQRLGYLLEVEADRPDLADMVFESMAKNKVNFYRTPLKKGEPVEGCVIHNRWKVVINVEIEPDF